MKFVLIKLGLIFVYVAAYIGAAQIPSIGVFAFLLAVIIGAGMVAYVFELMTAMESRPDFAEYEVFTGVKVEGFDLQDKEAQ